MAGVKIAYPGECGGGEKPLYDAAGCQTGWACPL
jgi:hypothetical protein